MHDRFGSKGLTIIGVTDESASKVEPYIRAHGIRYVIAIGGGRGYRTSGIPHAWLVSPDRKIVWEGHPAALTEAIIEKHLSGGKG